MTGSINSGRRSGSANVKPLLEDNIGISCHELNRKGLLSPGKIFYIDYNTGSIKTLSLNVEAQTDALHLRYQINGRAYTQTVSIQHQSCHYGGKRPYFVCPKCFQKRTDLYLGKTGDFRCRVCQAYAYRSQRLNAHQRNFQRAMLLKKKLTGADQPYFCIEKPKGMWNRTFNKIVDKIIMHETASCGLFIEYCNVVVEKFNSQMDKTSDALQ